MGIKSFEQLDVWSKAHKIVLEVYRQSRVLPGSEKYGLQSQMRRAAVLYVPTSQKDSRDAARRTRGDLSISHKDHLKNCGTT